MQLQILRPCGGAVLPVYKLEIDATMMKRRLMEETLMRRSHLARNAGLGDLFMTVRIEEKMGGKKEASASSCW